MKRYTIKVVTLLILCCSMPLQAHRSKEDIPLIELHPGWIKIPNKAEYKEADWENAICRVEGVTIQEAVAIANRDPRINYFFYVKEGGLILENFNVQPPIWRLFNHGDAVFFSGEPNWANAYESADGYVKHQQY